MRFFPTEPAGRLAIVKSVAAMSGSEERACWIVDQMLALTNDWPGILEVRGVYCLRFKPADGVEGESEICPTGQIPADSAVGFKPRTSLAPQRDPRSRELPPGEVGEMIRSLVGRKSF